MLGACRSHERPVEEESREHKEADQTVAELRCCPIPAVNPRARRAVVEPDVEEEDRERRETAETVESATAVLVREPLFH